MITAQECKQMALNAKDKADRAAFEEAKVAVENSIRHAAACGNFYYSVETQDMSTEVAGWIFDWLKVHGFLVSECRNPINITWLVK